MAAQVSSSAGHVSGMAAGRSRSHERAGTSSADQLVGRTAFPTIAHSQAVLITSLEWPLAAVVAPSARAPQVPTSWWAELLFLQ